MSPIASSLIDWSALWRIGVAAFVGGTGVVLALGILLLALKRARSAQNDGVRLADWGVAVVSGGFCVAAVAIGIYAMAHKPKPKRAEPAKSAELVLPRLPAG